jgi:hypothetical protein
MAKTHQHESLPRTSAVFPPPRFPGAPLVHATTSRWGRTRADQPLPCRHPTELGWRSDTLCTTCAREARAGDHPGAFPGIRDELRHRLGSAPRSRCTPANRSSHETFKHRNRGLTKRAQPAESAATVPYVELSRPIRPGANEIITRSTMNPALPVFCGRADAP